MHLRRVIIDYQRGRFKETSFLEYYDIARANHPTLQAIYEIYKFEVDLTWET